MSSTKCAGVLPKATFAMSWFWFPEAQFGCAPGVVRTRVGYAGGSKLAPTYHAMGDHTESVDMDYDPAVTTYSHLLKMFWKNHDSTSKCTRQYMSAIFYHDEDQKQAAEESLKLNFLFEGIFWRSHISAVSDWWFPAFRFGWQNQLILLVIMIGHFRIYQDSFYGSLDLGLVNYLVTNIYARFPVSRNNVALLQRNSGWNLWKQEKFLAPTKIVD